MFSYQCVFCLRVNKYSSLTNVAYVLQGTTRVEMSLFLVSPCTSPNRALPKIIGQQS